MLGSLFRRGVGQVGVCSIRGTVLRHNQQCRCDKGKAGTQVGRGFPLGDGNKQKGSHTVHKQHHRRVDSKKKRNQDRSAEHSEHVLNAQGN